MTQTLERRHECEDSMAKDVSEEDPAVRRGEAHLQARVKDLIITARVRDLIIKARVKDLITSDRACTRCIYEKGVAEHARGVSTKTVEQISRSLARDHH